MAKQDDDNLTTSTEAILESISDGVFTVDNDWRITSFNRAAEEITGTPRDQAIGQLCSEVFRSSMCENHCALRQTLADGKPIINRTGYMINATGRRIPISISTAVLRDSRGRIIGGAETFRDLSEVEALRKQLSGQRQLGDLVSHSPVMHDIFQLITAVAASSSTVLIQGETGTGKELVARAIHSISDRAAQPFIAVNCGALPDTLLESELFGHKKGAFTGAVADKPGRFAAAGRGTLFLDEIGEISPALQVRLLRVLQEHQFEPLGSTRSEPCHARILAATNRNLEHMVEEGEFRRDLFYRIQVVQIDLPPLRQRMEDLPLLVDHFIQRFNQLQHKNITSVTPAALSALMAHHWPGNVRELENVVERAFVLCKTSEIDLPCLPTALQQGAADSGAQAMRASRRQHERQVILAALKRNHYNRAATARELNIHKATLYRKINALNIALPDQDGRHSTESH
nr:sigma 54-interacting transcriptional regulator [uncultured Desulfuromonas sp.]